MSQTLKEPLKFATFLVFAVGLLVLACIFIAPIQKDLASERRIELVRTLVPGIAPGKPAAISDAGSPMVIYPGKGGNTVVFVTVALQQGPVDLAVVLEKGKVKTIVDANPGLAPGNSLLAWTLQDLAKGGSVDRSRISRILTRVVEQAQKAVMQ